MATRSRRRHGWWCGLLLILCDVAVPDARQYRTVDVESLRVTVDSEWVSRAAPGYLPIRFEITNAGDARILELLVQGTRFFRTAPTGSAQVLVRQVVRLEPNDRVRLTVPVPVFADSENLRIDILDGNRTLERFTFAGLQSQALPANASVLIVADASSAFGAIAATLPRPMLRGTAIATSPRVAAGTVVLGPPSAAMRIPVLDLQLDSARLPANWLAFTSVRAVAIGRDEWNLLNDGQRSALLAWTASGGDLIFVDGGLDVLLPGAHGESAADPDRIVGRHFFGRIHVLSSASLATVGLAALLSSAEKNRDLLWALPATPHPIGAPPTIAVSA